MQAVHHSPQERDPSGGPTPNPAFDVIRFLRERGRCFDSAHYALLGIREIRPALPAWMDASFLSAQSSVCPDKSNYQTGILIQRPTCTLRKLLEGVPQTGWSCTPVTRGCRGDDIDSILDYQVPRRLNWSFIQSLTPTTLVPISPGGATPSARIEVEYSTEKLVPYAMVDGTYRSYMPGEVQPNETVARFQPVDIWTATATLLHSVADVPFERGRVTSHLPPVGAWIAATSPLGVVLIQMTSDRQLIFARPESGWESTEPQFNHWWIRSAPLLELVRPAERHHLLPIEGNLPAPPT